jgi:hypothetical protein
MACRGLKLFFSFLIRDRSLDEWLPNDLKRRRLQPCGIGDCVLLFTQGLYDGCPLRGTSERLHKIVLLLLY